LFGSTLDVLIEQVWTIETLRTYRPTTTLIIPINHEEKTRKKKKAEIRTNRWKTETCIITLQNKSSLKVLIGLQSDLKNKFHVTHD